MDARRAEATLAACLRGGRLPHAVLVEDRVGGAGLAEKIARAALCSGDGDKPCEICRDCLKSGKGVHPDMLRYSGGDRTRSFHIDTVRLLRREAYIRPNEADRKVFILENAHNMTVQAQNALLKIIEEPPAGVMFILVCDNRADLIETVLSRVSIFTADATESEHDEEQNGLREKAGAALDSLLSGSELEALAAFAPYERDRAGFSKFLAAMREGAASRLTTGRQLEFGSDARPNSSRRRDAELFLMVELIDELDRALIQNVGGLLASVTLPAKFRAARRGVWPDRLRKHSKEWE